MKRRIQAFSLIELMIVMAIISVLAAMMLPSLEQALSAARVTSCGNQQREQYLAFMMRNNEKNGLPGEGWGDGLTALVGGFSNPADPYRWSYGGMGQVWAQGYFDDLMLFICPGFVTYDDEIANGWGRAHLLDCRGKVRTEWLLPKGGVVNGTPTYIAYNGTAALILSCYTLTSWKPYTYPEQGVRNFDRRTPANYPLLMCAQSIWNPNQAGGNWIQRMMYDSHGRKDMNCTYTDGVVKSLPDVWSFTQKMYALSDWTWQMSGTDSDYYWARWAYSKR